MKDLVRNAKKWVYVAMCSAALAQLGCGSSVEGYCSKLAECSKNACDYRDDVCETFADSAHRRCIADNEAYLESVGSGSNDRCDKCVKATEAFFDCAASLKSCAAFDDAGGPGADCQDESMAVDKLCADIKSTCYQ